MLNLNLLDYKYNYIVKKRNFYVNNKYKKKKKNYFYYLLSRRKYNLLLAKRFYLETVNTNFFVKRNVSLLHKLYFFTLLTGLSNNVYDMKDIFFHNRPNLNALASLQISNFESVTLKIKQVSLLSNWVNIQDNINIYKELALIKNLSFMAEDHVDDLDKSFIELEKKIKIKFFTFIFFNIKRIYQLFKRKLFFFKYKSISKKFNFLFKQISTHFVNIVKFKKKRIKKFKYFRKLKVKYHFNALTISKVLYKHIQNKIHKFPFINFFFNLVILSNLKKKFNFDFIKKISNNFKKKSSTYNIFSFFFKKSVTLYRYKCLYAALFKTSIVNNFGKGKKLFKKNKKKNKKKYKKFNKLATSKFKDQKELLNLIIKYSTFLDQDYISSANYLNLFNAIDYNNILPLHFFIGLLNNWNIWFYYYNTFMPNLKFKYICSYNFSHCSTLKNYTWFQKNKNNIKYKYSLLNLKFKNKYLSFFMYDYLFYTNTFLKNNIIHKLFLNNSNFFFNSYDYFVVDILPDFENFLKVSDNLCYFNICTLSKKKKINSLFFYNINYYNFFNVYNNFMLTVLNDYVFFFNTVINNNLNKKYIKNVSNNNLLNISLCKHNFIVLKYSLYFFNILNYFYNKINLFKNLFLFFIFQNLKFSKFNSYLNFIIYSELNFILLNYYLIILNFVITYIKYKHK